MRDLFARPILEIGDERYCWGDVLVLALMNRRWIPLEREIREGLACLAHAEATGIDLPEPTIETLSTSWRDERDLLTADEAEKWLTERNLTVGGWMEWARREGLRQEWFADLERLTQDYPVAQIAILDSAPLDLLCGRRGRQLAFDLARRVAAAAQLAEQGERFEAEPAPDLAPRILPRLPGIDPARILEGLPRLVGLEPAYARFRITASTPERIQRELEIGRLEWVRLDCRVIQFASETLAREAEICLREDGLEIDQVVRDTHASVDEIRFFLGELDPELRPRLLSGRPNELLGPVLFEGTHALFLILDKVLPDESSPDLRHEIERRALARAETEEIERRVRWLERY